MTTPTRLAVFSPMSMLPKTIGPTFQGGTPSYSQIQCVEEIEGKKTPENLPKETATAAIVPSG